MSNDMELLNKIKENSIGDKGKVKKEIKTKKITSKKILAALFAVLLSISLCACNTSDIQYDPMRVYYLDMYTGSVDTHLRYLLRENDMEIYQANNTIEEYQNIKEELKEEDMYIYYQKLGREECEKICIVFGYEGLDDYLVKNGYVDETGNPSIDVCKEETYDRIAEEMAKERQASVEEEMAGKQR